MSSGDQDSNLFACLGELIGLNRAVVVQIKVLKVLEQNSFFVLIATSFLGKLGLNALLETANTNSWVLRVRMVFREGIH